MHEKKAFGVLSQTLVSVHFGSRAYVREPGIRSFDGKVTDSDRAKELVIGRGLVAAPRYDADGHDADGHDADGY